MATASRASPATTETVQEAATLDNSGQTLTLRLSSPREKKKVQWGEGTVDNENMDKKKSKCCCIYEKPRIFGESSSEDESDEENRKCRGPKDYHKDVVKKRKKKPDCEDCSHCH